MTRGLRPKASATTRPVEIVIKATDNASKNMALISLQNLQIERTLNLVRAGFAATGTAVAAFSIGAVASITDIILNLQKFYALLQRPISRQIINSVQGLGTAVINEMRSFTVSLDAAVNGVLGPQKGAAIGNALGSALGQGLYGQVAASVNLVDQKILSVVSAARKAPSTITGGLDILGVIPSALAGFGEPLELFKGLQKGVQSFASGIIGVTQELGQFGLGISALQQLVNFGPFNALIQQNIQLKQQLLSTQTSLTATNDVLIGGSIVEGSAASIKALEGPVLSSISKLRRDSLELVGVTSKDLVSVYNILSSQISGIGGDLNDASDLTISFAAALGTLGIPLDQARQEINSILMGQVTSDSYLAKSIGLTSQQLQIWRQQGTVVGELQNRLEAFAEGNKLAARSVSGISSNIQEVFDEILRNAGEPILEPVIQKLDLVYQYINANSLAIQKFVSVIVTSLIEVGEIISRVLARIFEPAVDIGGNLILLLVTAVTKAARGLEDAFNKLYPVIEPILETFKVLANRAETITLVFFKMFVLIQGAKLAVTGLSTSFSFLSNLFPFVGEAMAVVNLRSSSMLSQFTNLTGVMGRFSAGGLLAAKNLGSIPGAAGIVSQKLGLLGPILTPLIPTLATAGISIAGLSKKYPAVGEAIQDAISKIPSLTKGVAKFAESSDFAGGILKRFAPQLHAVAEGSKEYGNAAKLSSEINKKAAEIAKEAAKGVQQQITSMALYSGAIFALFFALDNLVLKNEGVMAILTELGETFSEAGKNFLKFLQTPAVSATIAIGALVVLITTGLIPSLLASAVASAKAISTAAVAQWGDLMLVMRTTVGVSGQLATNLARLTGFQAIQGGAQGASAAMTVFTTKVRATNAEIARVGTSKFVSDLAAAKTAAAGSSLSNFWSGLAASAKAAMAAIVSAVQGMAGAAVSALRGLRTMIGSLITSFIELGKAILAAAGRAFTAARTAIANLGSAIWKATIRVKEMAVEMLRMGLAVFVTAIGSVGTAFNAMSVALVRAQAKIKLFGLGAFVKELFATAVGGTAAGGGMTAFAAGIQTAANAAKTLVTTLGPIALAIVGIAAVTEVIRILHEEFFAGNKVLKEYLKNLRDAEVEVENAATRVKGDTKPEEPGQFATKLAAYEGVQEDKNFVTKGFEALGGALAFSPAGAVKTIATEGVSGLDPRQDKVKNALQQLADEEAGLIKLTDAERALYQLESERDRSLNVAINEQSGLLAEIGGKYNEQKQEVVNLKTEMEGLVTEYNAGNLTDEEFQSQSGEIDREIEARIKLINQGSDDLKKKEGLTVAGRRLIAQSIADNDALVESLGRINSTSIEQKDLPRLGTEFEQLTQKAAQAEEAFVLAKGDPAQYAQKAKEFLETTDRLIETNLISEEEALRRLSLVANATELDGEVVKQAQTAITKTIEGQSQERLGLIKNEQAGITQAMKDGSVGQVTGQQQLLALIKEEGVERLATLQAQYDKVKALRAAEQASTIAAQEALILDAKARLAETGGPETTSGKPIVAEIAAIEAAIASNRQVFAAQAAQSETEYQGQRVQVQSETAGAVIASEQQVYDAKVRNLDKIQEDAQNVARKAQLDTDIQNQRLLNSGSITQEALAQRRAASNQQAIASELDREKTKLAELEKLPQLNDPEAERQRQLQIRAARIKTQELTLQLLEGGRQAVEANIALLEKDLRNAARGYNNELEQQIQSLERQNKVSDQLTKSHELRKSIAEAENSLAQASAGYVSSEFDLLAQTTKSEYRKQQIAQATAAIKLQTARLEAEFARKSLDMEYEQNRLARERELAENRIAILRAQQAVRQGDADVSVAQEKFNNGLITQAELNEVLIKQQGTRDQLSFVYEERGLIQQQQVVDERIFGLRRQQGELQAGTAERQAQVGLAQALPPGLRERALNQVGDDIAQSFGFASRSDLINAGSAMARQSAQSEFGVGQGSGGLSAFDPGLEGLREQLSPAQYAAAVQDAQTQSQRQLGPQPFSLQQDQLLGRGATPFQLPGITQPQGSPLRLPASEITGRDIGFSASAQAPIQAAGTATSETDRLISAFQQGNGAPIGQPIFNIEVNSASGAEGQTVANQVQTELEKLFSRSREIIRAR